MESFRPPYCPNPSCRQHKPADADPRLFVKNGAKAIQRFPYVSPRFRCNVCRKTFAISFFHFYYRDRKFGLYEEIHTLLLKGDSIRDTARFLKVDEDTVRRKKKKLARWALLEWASDLQKIRIKEAIAYDGLENFSHSQYEPNNLNHAVGKASYFIYDFNLSPMNRKGYMSPRQQRINKRLVEKHGKFSTKAIEDQTKKLFERLLAKTDGELHLYTDCHRAYRYAIGRMHERKRIFHAMTSSKVARNFRNALFPINHTDMLTRHQLAAFKRETIAFSKHSVAMLETFVLFATYKNYMRPRFWRPHVLDPSAHIASPAMALGLRSKILKFSEFYRVRKSVHQVNLNEDWQDLFDSTDQTSRPTIRPYGGI